MKKKVNIQNLKPFKKGVSGNPLGKPIGIKSRKTTFRKWFDIITTDTNKITGEKEELSIEDQIAIAAIKKAISGDVHAIKEVFDSVYGEKEKNINATVENFNNEPLTEEMIEKLIKYDKLRGGNKEGI